MTCRCSILSPFRWADGLCPSAFSSDKKFAANANGESHTQVAVRNLQLREEKTGRSPGAIYGISQAANQRVEQYHLDTAVRVKRKRATVSSSGG